MRRGAGDLQDPAGVQAGCCTENPAMLTPFPTDGPRPRRLGGLQSRPLGTPSSPEPLIAVLPCWRMVDFRDPPTLERWLVSTKAGAHYDLTGVRPEIARERAHQVPTGVQAGCGAKKALFQLPPACRPAQRRGSSRRRGEAGPPSSLPQPTSARPSGQEAHDGGQPHTERKRGLPPAPPGQPQSVVKRARRLDA